MKTTTLLIERAKAFCVLLFIFMADCADPKEYDIKSFISAHEKHVDALRVVCGKGGKVESTTISNAIIIKKFLKAASYSSEKNYWINTRTNKGACDFYLLSQGEEIAEISLVKLSEREGFIDFRAHNYTNDSLLIFSQKVLGLF